MEDYLFSYATPEDPRFKRGLIRLVERATGQSELKRLYLGTRRYTSAGESIWAAAVRQLKLDVRYDAEALARWPKSGPLVVVANHPYGVLDGVVISWLVEQARPDYVVLTNAALMRAPEIHQTVLPIDFSPTPGAREINLKSRAAARARLARGGVVVVFPSGAISTAPDRLGRHPAVDARWQPFVAQLVQLSRATVAPVWFGGQNSRLFQIASHLSLTLRLSLIFHEVRRRIGATVPVEIGEPIPFERLAMIKDRQAFADKLRAATYALARDKQSAMRASLPPRFEARLFGRLPPN
jgi:putative hemolysin